MRLGRRSSSSAWRSRSPSATRPRARWQLPVHDLADRACRSPAVAGRAGRRWRCRVRSTCAPTTSTTSPRSSAAARAVRRPSGRSTSWPIGRPARQPAGARDHDHDRASARRCSAVPAVMSRAAAHDRLAARGVARRCAVVASAAAASRSRDRAPTTEPATPSVQLGAQLYAANCSSCHGIAGSGISSPRPGAGDILGEGPSLAASARCAADFYLRTATCRCRTPTISRATDRVLFSDKEITSLVALRRLARHGAAGSRTPIPARARSPRDRSCSPLHCAGCHQERRRGRLRHRRARAAAAGRSTPPRSPRRCGSGRT